MSLTCCQRKCALDTHHLYNVQRRRVRWSIALKLINSTKMDIKGQLEPLANREQ